MTKHLIRLSLSAFLLGLAVIPFALPAGASHITTSYHKNTMWASAQVSQSWHGVNEDAIDLRDPDCSQNNHGAVRGRERRREVREVDADRAALARERDHRRRRLLAERDQLSADLSPAVLDGLSLRLALHREGHAPE